MKLNRWIYPILIAALMGCNPSRSNDPVDVRDENKKPNDPQNDRVALEIRNSIHNVGIAMFNELNRVTYLALYLTERDWVPIPSEYEETQNGYKWSITTELSTRRTLIREGQIQFAEEGTIHKIIYWENAITRKDSVIERVLRTESTTRNIQLFKTHLTFQLEGIIKDITDMNSPIDILEIQQSSVPSQMHFDNEQQSLQIDFPDFQAVSRYGKAITKVRSLGQSTFTFNNPCYRPNTNVTNLEYSITYNKNRQDSGTGNFSMSNDSILLKLGEHSVVQKLSSCKAENKI